MSQMGFKRCPHRGSKVCFKRPQTFRGFRCQDYLARHVPIGYSKSKMLGLTSHRGKGMARSRAEGELRAFAERTQIPFLPDSLVTAPRVRFDIGRRTLLVGSDSRVGDR